MNNNQTLDPIAEQYKLYSAMSIRIATFLGTPIAAGILIRKNYVMLGDEDKGKNALIISIIATLGLFVVLYFIPESMMDRIPNLVIPIMYMTIVHYYVQSTLDAALKKHEANGGAFYSGWRAAGIGLLVSAILVPAIFLYAYYGPQDFDAEAYDSGIERFQKNEEEALAVYDMPEDLSAVDFIRETGIPLWEENIEITQELDKIEGLYPEYIEQNKILREYSEIRVESYQLLEKAIIEQTSKYNRKLELLYSKIDATLADL